MWGEITLLGVLIEKLPYKAAGVVIRYGGAQFQTYVEFFFCNKRMSANSARRPKNGQPEDYGC